MQSKYINLVLNKIKRNNNSKTLKNVISNIRRYTYLMLNRNVIDFWLKVKVHIEVISVQSRWTRPVIWYLLKSQKLTDTF